MKKMLSFAAALVVASFAYAETVSGLESYGDLTLVDSIDCETTGARADWMAGKRGMMVHWLFGEPGRIDYYVNGFDINKFMADFDATKSDYLIFTVGQNTGAYASPNSKITAYAGAGHCPTRDLVGEIAAAVHARGKKFIAYLPCELNANTTLHEGFGWPAAGSGKDMSTFQTRWLEVIREWAVRWGSNLDGWWIDGYTDGGTHWPDAMSDADEALWAAALRAGNSNAVITFNNGLAAKTPRAGAVLEDYLAGEINSPSALNGWTLTEFAEGTTSCRTHFLMPIDGFWGGYWSWDQAGGANPYSGRGLPNQQTMNRLSYVGQFPDPVVSESDLSAMIQSVFAVHGAVTINIGVNASGTLNPASVALLAKMPGGSESASADPGTTVESLIGSWSSTPMASDGSTFSTDGDLVYAYSTASADKTVNGITFKAAATPTSASSDFEFSPAFNTTQNAESDTMSGDLETIAKLAWKNNEKGTGGYATMTFKGLTAGKRYLIQLYIHDTYCHSSAVFGPDAKSTVIYRLEESEPYSGQNWTCGGVFTGVITAKGATHEITLNYPATDRIELNALQVRCLGGADDDDDEIVRPEDAPVAEESVIDAMTWETLFPTAKTFADTATSFDLPYRQHSPTTADGVKYPLVIFLHGAGEIGTDNEKQVKTENDVIPLTKYAMKHGDAFVLAPQCPGRSGSSDYSLTWSGADWENYPMTRLETPTKPMAAVIKLITDFMANNPVDPTRVYVTGLSMGGFGTWDLASRMTTTFAAVMPCCGGADAKAVELYRGQSIRFFHGSSDLVVNPEFSRGMDTALTTAGIEHDYIEYSGTGHDACWRKAYVDTDLNLEWLFGHIKGEEYVAPDHGDTTPNAPLSDLASGGWLSWKLKSDGSAIVDRGTKVWAYAQNYSCVQGGGHYLGNLVVNGVEFTKSGSFGDMSTSLSCDRTFSGKDTFGTEDLSDSASDFARMLKTGWEAVWDQGPVQTYTLHGLTSGKMYLVQFIYHCGSTDRAALSVIAPDGTTSTRVNGWDANGQNLDENWRYGGSLIGVFTASGTDQALTITYSKTANYLLNAVQLREVTAEELTSEPEIVYGTPTIGSVTASVSGTTATLTLANVTVGQNGGCYQVWLAYAEDGTELGDEVAVLISQQSSSCAVVIENLTPGKIYNCSLFVKNEGNVASEKKTGSFAVPGGGDDPVDPPSGDGNWTATPMDAAGDAFSREGDPVFAFMRDRGDPHETTYKEMVSGLYFNWINLPTDTVTKNHATGEAMDGVDGKGHDPAYFMSMSPAFNNATDKCGDGGLTDGDDGFAGMLKRAWTGDALDNIGDDAGQATLTLNNLTANRKYCLQVFIHEDSPNKLKGIKAPDGTVAYAGNFGSVTDCPRGSVLTCNFVATGTQQSFVLTYLDRGSYQMNAIQLRDLGEAGDEPEPQGETIASEAAKLGVGRWLAMPLTGDPADIVTDGTLVVINNKKLSGAKSYGTVNGVDFGGSWNGDGGMTSSPEVSNGKNNCTDCQVADTAYNNILKNAFTGTSAAEHQVFTFANLTPNATYLVQYICHGQSEFPRSATATDALGEHRIELSAATSSDEWYYGGTLIHVFKASAEGTYELTIDFRDSKGAVDAIVNAFQVRAVERSEEPEPPAPPPVYRLTIPAKTGLVLGSVTTNGTPVAETEGAYLIVSNTEVTITFTAASGYELDGNDGKVVKTIESDMTLADADYPAVKEETGGGDDPEPPSGEDAWTAKPMSADLHEFVTDGTVVWAKAAPSGDPGFAHVANGIDFMESQISDLASVVTVDPAFSDTKDKCGWEGLGADKDKAGTFMGRAWVREGASNGGVMTMTVGNLTTGHRYCLQLMIHNDGDSQGGFNPGLASDTMTAPDGKATINYGGTGWQYGGTLIGTFVADAATKSFSFTHSRQNYFQLNAIQLRDLGEAGDDPEPVEADPDTSWMAGSFGVSFHWTAKIVDNYGSKNWEQAVANFSVKNFADSVESFGAQHVIFTVAHAWQQLPCPCAALDSYITGRTTTRDLMKDIIDELTNRNIRVIFYYNHSCNHNEDSAWQAASGYNDITDESSMAAFGAKICSIVRELSLRYGDGVSAWWFDSATSVDDSEPWPNTKKSNYVAGLRFPWDNLFAAARAGNPHAAVAVNWDVGATNQHGLATDYLSGETEKIDAYGNCFPFAPEGLQDHIWTRMDSSDWFWQGGEVKNYGSRFSAEQLAWWKVSHRDAGRMATLNLVIDEAGNINPVVAGQLVNAKTIGKVWSQGRYDPVKWQAAPAESNLVLSIAGECAGDRSPYTDGYHRTPMTVLTDGDVPMTAIVPGANLTNEEKAKIFESLEGNVFTWTLAQASDIYGLNIYSRSSRSQYNGATDGGNDAIVVAKVEVQSEGSADWVDINAPSLSFGKGDGVSGGALVAKLADGSGAPLATGVTAIRFTQGATENGASLLVECEVIGCKSAPQRPKSINDFAREMMPGDWFAAPMTGDPNDIVNDGTLVASAARAAIAAGDSTVSGVPFSSDKGILSVDISNNADAFLDLGLSGGYGSIMKNGWYASNSETKTFKYTNLSPGTVYLVQFIVHDGRTSNNPPLYTRRATVPGDATRFVQYGAASADDEWYYGGTLIHVFKATDTTYSFNIDYPSKSPQINAIQLRKVSPSPSIGSVAAKFADGETVISLEDVNTYDASSYDVYFACALSGEQLPAATKVLMGQTGNSVAFVPPDAAVGRVYDYAVYVVADNGKASAETKGSFCAIDPNGPVQADGAAEIIDGDSVVFVWSKTNQVGTLTLADSVTADYLLVGGGGAGGYCRGGGGGGGGVVYKTAQTLASGSYSIVVGAGGVPDVWEQGGINAGKSTPATNGKSSVFSNSTELICEAFGGGGGGSFNYNKSADMNNGYGYLEGVCNLATGGGAAGKSTEVAAGFDGQGCSGGAAGVGGKDSAGAGGGGADGSGTSPESTATPVAAGSGGAGRLCVITGSDVYYGGGGGGGVYGDDNNKNNVAGEGGRGGGGHGGSNANENISAGEDGLGGGGGGASGFKNKSENCGGARGGSGTVIIRMPLSAVVPPEPPAPPPVYRLTIPAKTGLVLGSVTTNGTPVAETEGAYLIVSNTEVTITFTAASGYELDGNDGKVVKTIESDTTLADADYPAVKEQGGGDEPEPPGPQPGELVNGRAEMKGWSMKRISIAPNGATETGFGWSAGDDPSSKSYSATESVMSFTGAQVVNTIQLFAPSSDMANMPSAFKVYGSDDGSSWSELLSVAGEADWFARECRYYTFRNETAYSHYKLSVLSTVSGNAAKLGVYNYFFAKPADPTTPWVWDPNSKATGFNDNGKLWRGDQELSAWQNGNRIQLRNNSSNVNAYDLDFSAGLVDVDGNPLSYTVYLENGIKSSKLLTRIIGAAVIDAVPGWGAQYCWYLNELSLGSAFTSFGGSQAFENAYSLQCLDLTQSPLEVLPSGTFNSAYNLKGDIVLKVKTFAASFARSHITSLILNEVETYGDGNQYFDPFGWCDCLTNVTLGAGLKDINCGRAFGKVGKDGSPAYVDIWWKGTPPTFTRSQPELFNEGANNRITHHLPWSQREAWIDFATNHGLTSFSLTLPDDLASADGIWESNSGAKSIVKWWDDAPPVKRALFIIFR